MSKKTLLLFISVVRDWSRPFTPHSNFKKIRTRVTYYKLTAALLCLRAVGTFLKLFR